MNIKEIPDSILAAMVRNGCYAKGTDFSDGTMLLVLAVPYGPVDDTLTLIEAMESFHELVSADDWEERNLMVLTVSKENQAVSVIETSYEVEVFHAEHEDDEDDRDPLQENETGG